MRIFGMSPFQFATSLKVYMTTFPVQKTSIISSLYSPASKFSKLVYLTVTFVTCDISLIYDCKSAADVSHEKSRVNTPSNNNRYSITVFPMLLHDDNCISSTKETVVSFTVVSVPKV